MPDPRPPVNAAPPVPAAALAAFVQRCLCAVGVPGSEAALVADSLTDADLRGIGSHGVLRLPLYVERLRKGLMPAVARCETLLDLPALVVVDAAFSLGQVTAVAAMDRAVERARATGIAAVLLRNASHFGAGGYYARRAAQAGFIGVALSNTAAMIVPPGGQRAVVGNNPVAIGVPDGAGGVAFVCDLALSEAAAGKIMVARDAGGTIPPTWALDAAGHPTTDPAAALASGLMQPMAGAKGYGLALAVEVLTGVLSGAAFGRDVASVYRQPDERQSLGQMMIAISPAAVFGDAPDAAPQAGYAGRIGALIDMAQAAGAAARLPGARGDAEHAAARVHGVVLSGPVRAALAALADDLGVAPLGVDAAQSGHRAPTARQATP